nr:hypothetical protein [Tanacetum cinerariifolium]
MDQNIDFSGSDQIQNPQYPDIHPLNDEFEAYTNDNDAIMNDLQFKLDNLQKNQQDFQKKCEQIQDDFQNQMWNFMQNFHDGLLIPPPGEEKEPEATTNTELSSTKDIHPLAVQEPSQDSNIRQLIREECCVEVPEQQKQKMENTMFELVKICQEKEFLCIHDDVDNLIESALDSKLLLINSNSQRLEKKEHEVKNVVEHLAERGNRSIQSLQNFKVVHKSSISFKNTSQISSIHSVAPIQSTKEPEHLLSMGYEHLSITPETKSDEVTESNDENLLPILSKCEVTFEDEIECNMPAKDVCSPVFTTFSNPLFKDNDDLDSSDDESLPDEDDPAEEFKIYSNPLFDEDEINSDKLDPHCFNVESDFVEYLLNRDTFIDFSSKFDFSELNVEIADTIIKSIPLLPIPVQDEGDIRFLEELLIDDSILSHKSFDSNFKENPSILRPPPKPPDVDAGEEIQVVMIDKDKFDDDYQIFMFDKVFSLLSAESGDTIFYPGISD